GDAVELLMSDGPCECLKGMTLGRRLESARPDGTNQATEHRVGAGEMGEDVHAHRRLLLTGWTIVRGALSLRHRPHRGGAAPTGLTAALVDIEALAEITRRTVGSQIVTQGRAACAYRLAQHRAHGAHQAHGSGACEAARRPAGPQARPEQRLARIDVAD